MFNGFQHLRIYKHFQMIKTCDACHPYVELSQVLSDEQKRKEYDSFGGTQENFSGFNNAYSSWFYNMLFMCSVIFIISYAHLKITGLSIHPLILKSCSSSFLIKLNKANIQDLVITQNQHMDLLLLQRFLITVIKKLCN